MRHKQLSPLSGSSAFPTNPASRKGPVWGALVVLKVSWMAECSSPVNALSFSYVEVTVSILGHS